MSTTARTLVATMRVPFLLLSPACVALGLAAAAWSGQAAPWPVAAAVLLGAASAHVAVNMLNEWSDFKTGLDATTVRTPFSGGSGGLPADPGSAPWVLGGGLVALALTIAIGLWLLATRSTALLPTGLAGVAIVLAYTPWITRHPLACLLAPGLGFGPLMVGGSAVAACGHALPSAYAASLVPLALASALLLLNQFPDMEADRAAGRRHVVALWGRPRAARLFAGLLLLAYACLVGAVMAGGVPPGALAGLATLPLAAAVAWRVWRQADDVAMLLPAMAGNVAIVLFTPLLMAAGGLLWT